MTAVAVTVELGDVVAGGGWTDITADVRVSDGITITRGRADEAAQTAPQTLTLTINNRLGKYSPRNPTGPYYGRLGRNTLIRVKVGTSVRLVAEASEWPPRWDLSGKNAWVTVTGAGIMRRLGQGNPPKTPGFRTYVSALEPHRYWPLDEGELAGFGRDYKGSANFYPWPTSGESRPTFKFAGSFLVESLPPSLQVFSTTPGVWDGYFRGDVGVGDNTAIAVDFVYKATTLGPLTLYAHDYNGNNWRLSLRTGANDDVELAHVDNNTGTVTSLANSGVLTAITDGELHHVRLLYAQNGANVDLTAYIDGVSVLTASRAATMDGCAIVRFTYEPVSPETSTGLGHVVVWNDPVPDVAQLALAMLGFAGETAGNRIDRVLSEALIGFTSVGNLDATMPMGPQTEGDTLTQVRDAVTADMGSLYEPRDTLGLAYRTRESTYNQTPTLTVDYSAFELSEPFEPIDDDQLTRNDVTAKREGGGTARQVLTSGRLSTQPPPDGVGTYATEVTVNVHTDDQLPGVAGWLLLNGTWDEARYPIVCVERSAPDVAGNPALAAALLEVDIDDMLALVGMAAIDIPNDVRLIVRGYTETIATHLHTFQFNCSPAGPYKTGVWNSDLATTGSRWNPGAVRTWEDLDTTETGVELLVDSGGLFAHDDGDYDVVIGGERMTVTAVSTSAVSFVAAGGGVSGNNAPLTSSMPPGVQVGDLVLIFASIRNSGAGTPNNPAGWTLMLDMDNARVFGRLYDGVWTMPQVTFSGGVLNADTMINSCAFRGLALGSFTTDDLNASAQNIATPGLGASSAAVAIWCGWKQDDWTSVTGVPPGATTINTRTGALGDDAAQVWAYKIITDPHKSLPASQFTISGGLAAISRGGIIVIWPGQVLTVTRSVNGVVKSHTSGAAVEMYDPARWAL